MPLRTLELPLWADLVELILLSAATTEAQAILVSHWTPGLRMLPTSRERVAELGAICGVLGRTFSSGGDPMT